MTEIISFPSETERRRRAKKRAADAMTDGAANPISAERDEGGEPERREAEILFFTGVRYSRGRPHGRTAPSYREM